MTNVIQTAFDFPTPNHRRIQGNPYAADTNSDADALPSAQVDRRTGLQETFIRFAYPANRFADIRSGIRENVLY